jgi:hypothetical protein
MNEGKAGLSLADMLMEGPRGRRLLLAYALASEPLDDRDGSEDSLWSAVFRASCHADPGNGSFAVLFRRGARKAKPTPVAPVTPDEVAERLRRVVLAEVTPELLLSCLSISVDTAMYWQEPHGEDVLAGTGPMRAALSGVAQHVAASEETAWWRTPMEERSQWAVRGDGAPPFEIAAEPVAVLRAAREHDVEAERAAVRERPVDPTASWGGDWCSRPSAWLPSSSRELFDGRPAGLWFMEDSLGWETVEATRLDVAAVRRVYEIDTSQAWAELCGRFPFEQTAQKRHDWYRTTGRAGRWVIPDWARVAEHYDAVHLQVAAYLAAAGTAIPVDADTATVIAGWNPDETYWFTSQVRCLDNPVTWVLDKDGTDNVWVCGDPSERQKAQTRPDSVRSTWIRRLASRLSRR